VQRSAHALAGGVQDATQLAPEQSGVLPEQLTPQAPQVVALRRSASQPSDATWLQSAQPGSHEAMAHAVPLHVESACGRAHVPQGEVQSNSVLCAGMQPPAQNACPAGHVPHVTAGLDPASAGCASARASA
jgi:hypothetical protein